MSTRPPEKRGLPRWAAALWPAFVVAFAGTAALLGILDLGDCPILGAGEERDPLERYSVTFFVLWAVGALSALATLSLVPRREP